MITGFNFVPGAAETMTSPTSVPLHLLALEQAAQPGAAMNARAVGGDTADSGTGDALLRSAIVNVAKYYLQIAATRSPAQMEALIWDNTSLNGADHGPSCAAFASLTLELAAQAVGQQSWVTGGTTYPWPLPSWADVRVDTNPASPQITSVVADAQAHGRWHPLGDGYIPQPGDWVAYDGHVAVVVTYSGGILDTIAADSLPDLTVNAHSSSARLADQGIAGFVDNGNLQLETGDTSGQAAKTAPQSGSTAPANAKAAPAKAKAKAKAAVAATAAVPGLPGAVALAGTGGIPGAGPAAGNGGTGEPSTAAVPGVLATGQLLGKPAASTAPRSKSPTSAQANVEPAPAEPSQSAAPPPAASPS